MRTVLSRSAALAAVLVLALPVTGHAAEVNEYAAEATTSAARLSIFEAQTGAPLLDLVGTDAFGTSDPMASASIDAITVLGETVASARTATSEKDRVRDPQDGDGCAAPVEAPGLTLDAVCAVASARAGNPGDTGNQDATASTVLTSVAVDGDLLSALLTAELDGFLTDLADTLGAGAVGEAIGAFTEECDLFLANPPEPIEDAPATVADLVGMSPVQLDALNEQISDMSGSSPCTAIIALSTQDLVQDVVDVAPLADALAGVELLDVTVDGARSEIAGADAAMAADAKQVFVNITGPSLDFLDDAINAIVQGMYDGFVAEIEQIAGQEVPEQFDITDELAGALDMIPLFGISDPLLTAVVSGGNVSADLDLTDGTATATGDSPFVNVSIAPGLVALLGGDPEQASVTVAAGQSQTLAEGTPLESTISVGALEVDDAATFEDTGLTGARATTSGTQVELLTGVEGGLVLTLAEASAGVFADTATAGSPDPNPDTPLPNTGGGAAVAAVLALGTAAALRRRRD